MKSFHSGSEVKCRRAYSNGNPTHYSPLPRLFKTPLIGNSSFFTLFLNSLFIAVFQFIQFVAIFLFLGGYG